jgi:hypothetical protein
MITMTYLVVNLTYPPELGLPIFSYGFEMLHGVLSYQENKNKHINKFLIPLTIYIWMWNLRFSEKRLS